MNDQLKESEDNKTQNFEDAYKIILNEFEEDDGEGDDSWWWEEGRQQTNVSPVAPIETNYDSANDVHKKLAPAETKKPFNSYEQCNRLIICSPTRSELIQRFCDIIDGLTADDEEAQIKLIQMIDSVAE